MRWNTPYATHCPATEIKEKSHGAAAKRRAIPTKSESARNPRGEERRLARGNHIRKGSVEERGEVTPSDIGHCPKESDSDLDPALRRRENRYVGMRYAQGGNDRGLPNAFQRPREAGYSPARPFPALRLPKRLNRRVRGSPWLSEHIAL
jgi:hypothetical protein